MTWTAVATISHFGYGSYSFSASQMTSFQNTTVSISISASTTTVIIYVSRKDFCGDNICNGASPVETITNCVIDCRAIFLEFENADGSGPVNEPTVNFYNRNPRVENPDQGPNKDPSVTPVATRTTGSASNTIYQDSITVNTVTYFETLRTGFISFYWLADVSNTGTDINGVYRLRVHLSGDLVANSLNYRFVNTWKPIDATPEPFGPTDLNLHLFHPDGSLDINNPSLLSEGFKIGNAVADSKQSGGPATMDISPGSNKLVAFWNSKPPRSSIIAPSQNNRYLVNSGSYIVIYGKTSNSGSGKQLGQIVLNEYLMNNPTSQNDRTSNLWWAGQFTADRPAQNQPLITRKDVLKAATITSSQDMIFDCEVYAHCASFVVPYSDTGR
jgi:hypothetical protein